MFHLSLPVNRFAACLEFYQKSFGARIVMLSQSAANVYAFGGQITLHDQPLSTFGDAQRREMHFGHVVSPDQWRLVRDRLRELGVEFSLCVEPDEASGRRGKLLVTDPSGNLVEVNST